MRISVTACAIVMLLGLAAQFVPAASADGSLVLLATYDERSYSPGEVMDFTLYALRNGEAVVPDEPPSVGVIRNYVETLYHVPVVATAPGRYQGRYTVLEADATDDMIELSARATYGRQFEDDYDAATETMFLSIARAAPAPGGTHFNARLLKSSDQVIRPGTRLVFQCAVDINGTPADPEGLRFVMHHSNGKSGSQEDPTEWQASGPGNYSVNYKIPDQSYSDDFYLYAYQANATGSYYTGARTGLDFYQVIYHELKRNGTRVDYELLVSDRGGKPVNGTAVSLMLIASGYDQGMTGLMDLGRTDSNGRVRSFFDFGGIGGDASIRGWANTSKASQTFSGSVRLPGEGSPNISWPTGFEVEETGVEGEVRPGGAARITYQAALNGQPLGYVPVDCYIRMDRYENFTTLASDVLAQRVVTDGQGQFRLNFTFPAGVNSTASMTFVGPDIGQSYYRRSSNFIWAYLDQPATASPWVEAAFSRAEPGASLQASVTGPGLAAATMSWNFDRGGSGSDQSAWIVLSGVECQLTPPANGSLPLKGRLVLPGQLRPGANLTVSLQVRNSSGAKSTFGFPVRVKSPPTPSAESDLCCIAGAAVLNIALLAFVSISYLGAKRAPPRKQFEDLDVDERITEAMRPPPGQGPHGPPMALPFKVELVSSAECTICGRRIAGGNLAYGCACGKKFHEHCLKDEKKCPKCGRDWGAR